jgi:hypothetical protein
MLQAGRIHDMIKRRRQLLQQKLYAVPQGKRWHRKHDTSVNVKHQVLVKYRDSLQEKQQQQLETETGGRVVVEGEAVTGAGAGASAAAGGEVPGEVALGSRKGGAAVSHAVAGLDLGAGGPLVVTAGGNVVLLPNEKEQELIRKLVERIRTVHFVRRHGVAGRLLRGGSGKTGAKRRVNKMAADVGGNGGEEEEEDGQEGVAGGNGRKGRRKGGRRAVGRLKRAAEDSDDERRESDGDEWGLVHWDEQGQQPLVGVAGLIAAVKGGKVRTKAAWWKRKAAGAPMRPGEASGAAGADGGGSVGAARAEVAGGIINSDSSGSDQWPCLLVAKAMELMLSLLYQSELVSGAVLSSEVAAALTQRFQGPVIAAAFAWLRRLGWMTAAGSRKPFRLTSAWRGLLKGEELGLDCLDRAGVAGRALDRQLKQSCAGAGEAAGEINGQAGGLEHMDVDGRVRMPGEAEQQGGKEEREGSGEPWMVPASDDGVWCALKLGQIPGSIAGSVPLQLIMGAAVGKLGLEAQVMHNVRMGEGAALMQARALLEVLVEVKPVGVAAEGAAAAAGGHCGAVEGTATAPSHLGPSEAQQQQQFKGVDGAGSQEPVAPETAASAAAASGGELGLAAYQCPHWIPAVQINPSSNAVAGGAEEGGAAVGMAGIDASTCGSGAEGGQEEREGEWSAWEVGGSDTVREAAERSSLTAADLGQVKGLSGERLRSVLGIIRSAGSDGIPVLQLQQLCPPLAGQRQGEEASGLGLEGVRAAAAGQGDGVAAAGERGVTGGQPAAGECVRAVVGHLKRYGLVRVVRSWWEEAVISSESSQGLLAYPVPKAAPIQSAAGTKGDGGEAGKALVEKGGRSGAAGAAGGTAGDAAVAAGAAIGSTPAISNDAPTAADTLGVTGDAEAGAVNAGSAAEGGAAAAEGKAIGPGELQLAPWLDHKGRLIEPFWQELVKRVMKLLMCNPGVYSCWWGPEGRSMGHWHGSSAR